MLILPAMTGQEPGGVAGGGDLRNPDCPVLQPVRIAAGTTTPIDMLDQIARQVRGITWLVTYRGDAPNRTLNIGLMCGDGSYMTFAVR